MAEEIVVPLAEESVSFGRRTIATGRVRLSLRTAEETRRLREVLHGRRAEVERVPIGCEVAEAPEVRVEGDVVIVPVLEEELVVTRRLVLREEIRLRLVPTERVAEHEAVLRRQVASVERLPPRPPEDGFQHKGFVTVKRMITGLFDTRTEADRAGQELARQLGLAPERLRLHEQAAGAGAAPGGEDRGILGAIADLFIPQNDAATYAEGIRRGGVLLTAEVEEQDLDRAMDILERHEAVDLDEREANWRSEGWSGGAAASGGGLSGAAASGGATAGAGGTAGMGATGLTGREESIPLAEEQLHVGKRQAAGGRVRVRSYVVETPVEEQVTLHEERVDVERRPASGTAVAGEDLFRERTIEATETSEEAVVQKEARIREEVVIRKEAEERTETVRDTVRRTEVEIEDETARGTASGAARRTTPERGA